MKENQDPVPLQGRLDLVRSAAGVAVRYEVSNVGDSPATLPNPIMGAAPADWLYSQEAFKVAVLTYHQVMDVELRAQESGQHIPIQIQPWVTPIMAPPTELQPNDRLEIEFELVELFGSWPASRLTVRYGAPESEASVLVEALEP